MKELLRKIFSFVLTPLEKGDEAFGYKPANRKILIAVSLLFSFMVAVILWLMPADAENGYFLPVLIFGVVALLTMIVGFLGSDRAVARLWGNR